MKQDLAAVAVEPLGALRTADRTGLPLLAIRLVLGATFIYMGTNKLADPIAFMKAIRQYQLLPDTPGIYLNLSAVVLPWMEVFAGAAMILGVHVRGAALAIIIMLSVFTPAVYLRAMEIQRETPQSFFDIKFDCGCGTGVEVIWQKLLSNFGYFLLAVGAVISRSRKYCLSMVLERRSAPTRFCHFCCFSVNSNTAGLCASCATPPAIS
jgi:uncharacterized membrane protein YphA (DoxX/SURF4 family)